MKQLSLMTNAEKVQLMTRLLPEETEPLLDNVLEQAISVVRTRCASSPPGDPNITSQVWVNMARDILEEIEGALRGYRKSPHRLAVALTGEYGCTFLLHAISRYGKSDACTNEKMRTAIELLFDQPKL
jgi:hypothetical protein